MSRESFSYKLTKDMYNKILALEDDYLDYVLDFDDTFELALALAYIVVSKEKIIEKDKKNDDNLKRLTRQVPKEEIDKLFTGKYSNMIEETEEEDNTWILDVIRDSIAHHKIDIDEDNEVIIFNNDFPNRKFKAVIPFSWFKDYLKSDLLSKRITNNFSYRSYYYNNNYYHKGIISKPMKSVFNNILYLVNIEGENIPIKEVTDKIEKLMSSYSLIETTEKEFDSSLMGKYKYNKKYFSSFLNAKEKLKKELEKDYPNSKIEIIVDDWRYSLSKRANKKLLPRYRSYKDLYQDLNSLVQSKELKLLNTYTDIYKYIEEINYNEELNDSDKLIKLLKIINKKSPSLSHDSTYDKNNYNEAKQKIFLLLLQVYGISTIVINNDILDNSEYLEYLDNSCFAYNKKTLEEYQKSRRTCVKEMLRYRRNYFRQLDNYNKCHKECVKESALKYNNLYEKQVALYEELEKNIIYAGISLEDGLVFNEENNRIKKEIEDLFNEIEKLDNFKSTKIDKEILTLYDELSEKELKYIGYAKTSSENTLVLIRDCFAHIGRINLSNYPHIYRNYLKLIDYSDDGNIEGKTSFKSNQLLEAIDVSAVNVNKLVKKI